MNKSIGTLITALLILIMAGLAMCATPELVEAPTKDAATFEPVIIDGHPAGFIAPPIMMVGDAMNSKMGKMTNGLPDAWDWRTMGGVTPVKDQTTACGSCYAFAFVSQAESGQMIFDPFTAFDLSENSVKECNWIEVIGHGLGSCSGGNALMCANLYSKRGSVLEADDPYVASDVECDETADAQYVFTDWVLFSDASMPDTYALKQAVKQQPVYTTLDATCLPGDYDGTYVIESGFGNNNHAVSIVGWDDNMGSSGAWIAKNSWNDTWGDNGYFYIGYGVAGIGKWTSYSTDWHPRDDDETLYYHDEGGWERSWRWLSNDDNDAWLLAEYIPHTDVDATHIEFWATEPGTDVDVYLYDSFDGNDVSSMLCSETGYTFDAGYHSIELTTPEPLVDGDPVYVVAYIDQSSILSPTYPIPTEGDIGPSNHPGKTFSSPDAPPGNWLDFHIKTGEDIGLRLRVLATEGDEPEPPEPTDPCEETGVVVLENPDGDLNATVTFEPVGELFNFSVEGNVGACSYYYLIYYADPVPGNNPGARIANIVADQNGDIIAPPANSSIELDMNLPEPPDDNIENCGARLWIVPCYAYNESSKEIIDWSNIDSFLFETCLIWYDDTDASANYEPDVLYVDPDGACYAAGDEVEITATVEDMDGYFDLENMVVEADLSAFGVDDPLVLDFVEATDCITGKYSNNTMVTIATTCECNYEGCMKFNVTATDPSQESGTGGGCMDVEPGPCDHLEFTPLSDHVEACGLPLPGTTPLLKWEYTQVNWDEFPWWEYYLYIGATVVVGEDEYGNMLYDVCCNTNVNGTGSASVMQIGEFSLPAHLADLPGNLVIYYNTVAVETCTLEAVCRGVSPVKPDTTEVEFLEPIMSANMTVDDSYLSHAGECSCEGGIPTETTVTAQILDRTGMPIQMAGVPVSFSAYTSLDVSLIPVDTCTDEFGIATSTVCVNGGENGTINVTFIAEGHGGSVLIDVIEPPCYIDMFADPDEIIEPDECGTPDCSYITGQLFDQYGDPVEVGGLEIDLYVNEEDCWQTVYTNDGGGIEATICTDHPGMELDTNTIFAEGCYAEGDVDIEMVEPVLTSIYLTPDDTPQTMELCEERDFTATCYNQNDGVMCCPEDLGWIILGENTTWDNGTLTAESVGSDTVWVETSDGTVDSNHIVIDVIQGDVTRLEVEMIELELCSSAPITVTCFDCNNDVMDCGGYDVSISPPEVASYSEGEVTGDAVGEAVLNVTIGTVYNTSVVNVTDTIAPVVSEVSIEPSTCCIGEVISIYATVDDHDIDTVYANEFVMESVGEGLYQCTIEAIEGMHVVNVTAEDMSGNMGYNDAQTYTAMNLAPVVAKVVLSPTSCHVGDTVTVNASVSDDCTANEDLIVEADGKNLTYTAGYFIGTFSAVEGTHNVTVTAEDGLGEIGENDSAQYTATKKTVKTSSSGGGSGGGTYPPNWDAPKNVTTGSSGNATLPPETEPEPPVDEAGVPEPTTTVDGPIGGGPVGNGNDTESEPTPPPGAPGFGAAFAILGLLAIAYLCYRKKQ